MLRHNLVDVVQEFFGDVADVVADGLVSKVGSAGQIASGNGWKIKELPDEGVVGSQIFELIIVAVAGVSHDPENKYLPEVEARTAFLLAFSGQNLLFQKFRRSDG